MHILELELATTDLAAQRAFYHGLLGLPLVRETAQQLSVQIGQSRLTFHRAAQPLPGVYHIAFNIPRNQFDQGKDWIETRTPLIADTSGETQFALPSWDARQLYFRDAAGNILEFIARQGLADDATVPFGPASLRNVSEVGIAADDVLAQAAALAERTASAYFDREPSSPTFTAIGDDHGLIIVVRRGRIWFPTTDAAAVPLPVTMHLSTRPEPLVVSTVEASLL